MTRGLAVAVALMSLAGCAQASVARIDLPDLAGDWRGRWLGAAGHAFTSLAVTPDGLYRMTMFLDGGDRVSAGAITALPSGRLRYQGADGNGSLSVEAGRLRFLPDGGGGGGLFERVN